MNNKNEFVLLDLLRANPNIVHFEAKNGYWIEKLDGLREKVFLPFSIEIYTFNVSQETHIKYYAVKTTLTKKEYEKQSGSQGGLG